MTGSDIAPWLKTLMESVEPNSLVEDSDPSKPVYKKLKTGLACEDTSDLDVLSHYHHPEDIGYIDIDYSPPDAVEPDWPSLHRETVYLTLKNKTEEWIHELEELNIAEKLQCVAHFDLTAVASPILEIFSISIHWNEKENMGGMQYSLYGNIFVEDFDHGCGGLLKVMKRSLQHPLVVSNGDNLPLRGLDRCLFCDDYISFFVCLLGNRSDSGLNYSDNESRVLMKEDVTLYTYCCFTTEQGKPLERTFHAPVAGDLPFLKIHYSVSDDSFVVGVEVRLVCLDIKKHFGTEFGMDVGRFCIGGALCVHWFQFEEWLEPEKLSSYKIILLDTEEQDSLSSSTKSTLRVRLGECFPIWRRKLAVPNEYTLVFDADIRTDKGHVFKGKKSISVQNNIERFFTCTFGDGSLDMQITLFNYYCL